MNLNETSMCTKLQILRQIRLTLLEQLPTEPGEEGLKLVFKLPDSSKIEGNFKKNSKPKVRVLNCTNHGYH